MKGFWNATYGGKLILSEKEKRERHMKYKNQDPNRPADDIDTGDQFWYDTNGKPHRDDDLPAIIWGDGEQEWYYHGKQHRETGPAVTFLDTNEFWINGEYIHSFDEWLSMLTCSDEKKAELIMLWANSKKRISFVEQAGIAMSQEIKDAVDREILKTLGGN